MTDNEIIKILTDYGTQCKTEVISAAISLINRQKAEIEMLKGWENLLKAESHAPIVKKAKSEAIKEFATKIYQAFAIENTRDGYLDCTPNYTRLMECVDDVLKELLGDNK